MKPVDLCRTWLFLPGVDKDVLIAAPGTGADVLIQDLEDFTPPELRSAARALSSDVYRAWKEAGCVAGVRVNRLKEDGQQDLAAVIGAATDIVFLPMVDEPAEMIALEEAVALQEASHGIPVGTTRLVPVIETARGLVQTGAIVGASPRIEAALLAAEDLAKDLGAERGRDGLELDYARQRFLVECRAASVTPIDRPYTWDDIDGAVADTECGRRFGYKAKCVVQPDHAEAINRVLTPSSEAVAGAIRIIESFEAARARGEARALVDGDLVEVPGYLSAKRTYDRAKALGVV